MVWRERWNSVIYTTDHGGKLVDSLQLGSCRVELSLRSHCSSTPHAIRNSFPAIIENHSIIVTTKLNTIAQLRFI